VYNSFNSRVKFLTVTTQQVKKRIKEISKNGSISKAALKAGMDEKTARKYVK